MTFYIIFILLIPCIRGYYLITFTNHSTQMKEFMTDSSSTMYTKDSTKWVTGVEKLMSDVDINAPAQVLFYEPVCESYKIRFSISKKTIDQQKILKLQKLLKHPKESSVFFYSVNKQGGEFDFQHVGMGLCGKKSFKVGNFTVTYHLATDQMTANAICQRDGLKFDPCLYARTKCKSPDWEKPEKCLHHKPTTTAQPSTTGQPSTTPSTTPSITTSMTPSITPTERPSTATPKLPDGATIVTPDNAQKILHKLYVYFKKLFHDEKIVGGQDAVTVVSLLYKLAQKEVLESALNKHTLLETLNQLLTQFIVIPGDAAFKSHLAARILETIGNIGHYTPLQNGSFVFKSEKLVMILRFINQSEQRYIAIWSNSRFTFGYNKTDIKLPPGLSDYVILPMMAIIESLTPDQQMLLNRLCVIFLNDNRLYKTNKTKVMDTTTTGTTRKKTFTNKVISKVIRVSFPGLKVTKLLETIEIGFRHKMKLLADMRCGYWNPTISGGFGFWSYQGCNLTYVNDSYGVCDCNHFTDFSLLMEVPNIEWATDGTDKGTVSYYVTSAGCVSVALLVLVTSTLYIYCLYRERIPKVTTLILLNLWGAILVSNLMHFIATTFQAYQSPRACKALAVFLHYFSLSTFLWIGILAFYMCRALVNDVWNQIVPKMFLFGWGLPFIIVTITGFSTMVDAYGATHDTWCWIRFKDHQLAFWIPLLIFLVLNGFMFGRIIFLIHRLSSTAPRAGLVENISFHYKGVIGIQSLNCLTWMFAFSFSNNVNMELTYTSAICNILQGFFIFIFYCLVNKEVQGTLLKRCKHTDIPTPIVMTTDNDESDSTEDDSSVLESSPNKEEKHVVRFHSKFY